MVLDWTKNEKDLSIKFDICLQKICKGFKYEPPVEYKNLSELWKIGFGHCGQYAELIDGVCRIFKIPSRCISGIIYGMNFICHVVAEVYAEPFDEWVCVEANEYYASRANFIKFQHYGD